MRLFLIRHGETVDNVAGLYAGIRDSELTSHGVLQIKHLASHLASRGIVADAIFSSDLRRAATTAEMIAAKLMIRDGQENQVPVEVLQLAELREKDFGTGEGARFGTRPSGPNGEHEGAESAEAMRTRADRFLDAFIMPMLGSPSAASSTCIVAAHGLILSCLFRALCARAATNAITVVPDAQAHGSAYGGSGAAPILPSWTNTGYLEADISYVSDSSGMPGRTLKLHVLRVNCTDHLRGLKKTRGGIGSAKFDTKQKTMDSFFATSSSSKTQKRKAED